MNEPMRGVVSAAIAIAAVVIVAKRGRRAVRVYVEEVSSGSRPIEGVGTAIAAFVGLAPGGPVNVP